LRKIENIVRQQMDSFGSQEIHLPALHPKANWVTTGAWDTVDVLFKLKSRTDREYALGQSHEEVVVPLIKEFIHSHKDLPSDPQHALSVYQIQWKFRDELRAKSGILRGREFLMKDMYSFHTHHDDFLSYYAAAKDLYLQTFALLGLEAKATQASGGNFTTKKSYEFMVLTDAGEDDILFCDHCDHCLNLEIAPSGLQAGSLCPQCQQGILHQARASEAGNIFDLGTGKSLPFDLNYTDAQGKLCPVYMGCYGIGISRAMGIIVEKHADTAGIVWPPHLAPFPLHLIDLGGSAQAEQAQAIYQKLHQQGREVLWDDRPAVSAGVKFANADLIGCPFRLVISPQTGPDQLELKPRSSSQSKLLTLDQLTNFLQKEFPL
jgi:prolyl-tRNA synthetase